LKSKNSELQMAEAESIWK